MTTTTRPLGARQTAVLDYLAEHGYWDGTRTLADPAIGPRVLATLRTRDLVRYDEANGSYYATAQDRLPAGKAAAEILAGLVEMAHDGQLRADEVHDAGDLHSQFDANMEYLAYMPAGWAMGDARYEKRWNDLVAAVDAKIKAGDLLRRAGCLPVDVEARLNVMPPAQWHDYLTATIPEGRWAPVSPDTITTANGSALEWHAGTRDWHLGYIDHRDCAPYLHSFDWEPGMEQAHDLNLMLCNDCRAPLFYCRADEWYHHANDCPPCFLADAQQIPVPDGFGSGGDDNDHEPCDLQTARLCGQDQAGAVAGVERYWITHRWTGDDPAPEIAGLQAAMITAAEQASPLPARFTSARAEPGTRIAVTDTETGATAVVGLHAYGEVRAALAALFGTVDPQDGSGPVGIPAALDCIDREAVICPVCGTEIPETYDGTGERTSNNYAGHYTREHQS